MWTLLPLILIAWEKGLCGPSFRSLGEGGGGGGGGGGRERERGGGGEEREREEGGGGGRAENNRRPSDKFRTKLLSDQSNLLFVRA